MNYRFERFLNDIKNKELTFLGLGISHSETIKLLAKKGIKISVRDKKTIDKFNPILINELKNLGINLILGEKYLDNINEDIVFRTPGMNYNHPILNQLHQRGIAITSEMEVFFDVCPCKIFGITGSDGKTTTSTLISEILKYNGYNVHLGGNIGLALLPIIESISINDYVVIELSSFQLISMRKSPDISVLVNISPNHLDVHKDMDEYINAKKNIFLHQGSLSKAVLNFDNEITRHFINEIISYTDLFSRKKTLISGTYLDDKNNICLAKNGIIETLFNTSEIIIPGNHNIENYLAAIAATSEYVNHNTYREIAKSFKGVEHRIEFVRDINNVKWYNDSIATTPSRTMACLNSFDKKLILIAGGYDKHIPFDSLASHIVDKVSTLILMGDTGENIYRSVINIDRESKVNIIKVPDMKSAVYKANELSHPNNIVLLSPASASYGLYNNFEERGKHFKQIVNEL